jgi:CRP/FNR family transcriptional regulator
VEQTLDVDNPPPAVSHPGAASPSSFSTVPLASGKTSLQSGEIPEAVWNKLRAVSVSADHDPGESLFWQGDPALRVYFLESGRVKITRNENGRELIVGLRLPGSFLGAPAALLGGVHPFSAQTLSTCLLRQLGAEALQRIAGADHAFCLHLLRSQLREMSEDLDNASGVGCLTVRQRLQGFLWRFACSGVNGRSGPLRLELPLRNWELAQLLAITPEHLSRVLKELEADGLVERRRGWLILPDPRLLLTPVSSHA